MGLLGLEATAVILTVRDWLEVLGTNAQLHSTEVVNLESRGNGTHEVLVRPSMRVYPACSVPEARVTPLVRIASPKPASGCAKDLQPETVLVGEFSLEHEAILYLNWNAGWLAPSTS